MSLELYPRLHLWLVRHRRYVLSIVLLVSVLSAIVCSRVNLEVDVFAILPQRDRIVDEYQYALRKFRQIERAFFDISTDSLTPDTLGPAADELHRRLSTNSAIERILYRFEMTGPSKSIDLLTGALPNLFTEADAAELTNKLEPEAVRDYLTVMRRKLAGLEGMMLKDVVAADPIGMSGLVVAKVLPLQTGFGDMRMEEGRIVSGDGHHVLLIAEPRAPSSDSKASAALVAEMLREAREVEQRFPGVHIALTGGHRMAVDNEVLIKGDANRCIFLGMASMLVLCLTAFRRRWLSAVTFLPSLFGGLLAGVAMAIWQPHLSAIALGFAVIAIGITVDYAIHIIYHLEDAAGANRAEMGHHLGRLVLPISAGALTSAAAFVVMASSPMRGYQQLGTFGAIGVVCSAAFAIIILPLLVPIPRKSGQPALWLTRLFEKFFAWRARRLTRLLVGMAVLSILTAVGVWKLRFEGDISKLNGITESTRHDDGVIRKTWGDALDVTLVVARGATTDEALAENDRALEHLARDPAVAAVYSLASICPSQKTQGSNIRRWHEFWSQARRSALRETLQRVGTELGFRGDAFDAFWSSFEKEPALITLDSFRGTPLEQMLNERVALAEGDNAVSTMLKLKDETQVERLRAEMPGLLVLDQGAFAQHIAALAKGGLGQFALWSGLWVAVILFFSFGSVALVAATLLPLAFGLLWTFGLMGWLGLPIDMMNSVFVIFVIGMAEDYGVFLVTSKLDEVRGRPERLATTSAAVLISALTTLFGFAVLVFARHPVLFSVGTTVLLGMICAFVATMVLTPFCMDLLLHHEQRARASLQARWEKSRTPPTLCRKIERLYRYQGNFVEQFVRWKMKYDPMFATLDGVAPRTGFILDLGCGYGLATHWLAAFAEGRTLLGVDYDEDKIRVAQCTAPGHERIKFEAGDILNKVYPMCDTVLLLDVLHYWQPAKQQLILTKVREALRPGGRLILRDGAREESEPHRRVDRWERFATRLGLHKTQEGLHFQSLPRLESALRQAGFAHWEIKREAGRGSNLLLVASVN